MLKLNKGFTLVELVLAVVLLGLVIGSVSVYSKYIGVMYKDIDKSAISSMAQLGSGVEYIVQRITHTNTNERTTNNPKGLLISDNGKKINFTVTYQGKTREASIYFKDNKLFYDYDITDAADDKVILTGVISVLFKQEIVAYDDAVNPTNDRKLAIEIKMEHKPYPIDIRTSVTGRNRAIPGATIN